MKIKLERDYKSGEEIDIPESEIVRAYNARAGKRNSSQSQREKIMKRWNKYKQEHGTGTKVRSED